MIPPGDGPDASLHIISYRCLGPSIRKCYSAKCRVLTSCLIWAEAIYFISKVRVPLCTSTLSAYAVTPSSFSFARLVNTLTMPFTLQANHQPPRRLTSPSTHSQWHPNPLPPLLKPYSNYRLQGKEGCEEDFRGAVNDADGMKKEERTTRKETYSSYIYRGMSDATFGSNFV